jgi:hypothetical protein
MLHFASAKIVDRDRSKPFDRNDLEQSPPNQSEQTNQAATFTTSSGGDAKT